MRVVDPGHLYELAILDGPCDHPKYHQLQFVKREGPGYPGNVGHYHGTTMQEVLRALVQRAEYVNKQIPCEETTEVVEYLKVSIWLLEKRAAKRHGRSTDFFVDDAVYGKCCDKCGHMGCEGGCHETP